MTPRYESCTIRKGSTTHFVRRHLVVDPDAVETYCGKKGMPWPVDPNANTCRQCKVAVNDEINKVSA